MVSSMHTAVLLGLIAEFLDLGVERGYMDPQLK